MATQCLLTSKMKSMLIRVNGDTGPGVSAKDIVLHIIGEIGTAGGTGHVIEYTGEAIRNLSMEGRMTICNMSIKGAAREVKDSDEVAQVGTISANGEKEIVQGDFLLMR